jgi:hypothetical protein
MKSSDLNKLLAGTISAGEFKAAIQDESSVYKKLMEIKGSTIPLKFLEDEEIILGNSDINLLIQEALAGNLITEQLSYICDCLTLGEMVSFENQLVEDIIYEFADPEINGGYKSKTELVKIADRLKTK